MSYLSYTKTSVVLGAMLLVTACAQSAPVVQTSPTTAAQASGLESYRALEVPVSFNYNKSWKVQNTDQHTVVLQSPATVMEKQSTPPAARGVEGDAMVEAFGKPDMEISFYSNIADEAINKGSHLGAKNVDELVKNAHFTPMGEVMVNGHKGYSVCDGEILCQYYWYVQTPKQVYRIYFGKQVSPETITLTPDEKAVVDSLQLLE